MISMILKDKQSTYEDISLYAEFIACVSIFYMSHH